MRTRFAAECVLLTAALPGLLFTPVFGFGALWAPIAVVLAACLLVVELCARVPALVPWRPLLALVAGLLVLAVTELRDLSAGAIPRALAAGATESWQLTLQSTWPARPDPELLLFVPMAVLLCAVVGIELLRWAPAAVLPGVALLGVSQAYVALSGPAATVAGLAFAVVSAALLVATRPGDAANQAAPTQRRAAAVALVVPILLGVTGAVAITAADQGARPSLSARDHQDVPLPPSRVSSPLDEVAARLKRPDTEVFTYTSTDHVDRWRLSVLGDFDGVGWHPDGAYRRLGAGLAATPGRTAPTSVHSAQLTVTVPGPWLPSQAEPAAVTAAAPLIDPDSGVLLLPDRTGPVGYGLSWRESDVDADDLAGAPIDPAAAGADGLGVIPAGISELASTAVGGRRPSFQTALVLERYLRQNYQVATGPDLPTGSSWPQLGKFLLGTKRGTSEQFAASYVALARILGIPARLAVGFRAPQTPPGAPVVVRNGDVLAWPEVAVAGVGWVPLDPSGAASGSGAAPGGLAAVTARARDELPQPQDLRDPGLPPSDRESGPVNSAEVSFSVPVTPLLIGLAALILLLAAGIPVAKAIRAARRRRRTGADGVIAAWWEARDLLRSHGVPCPAGITVRELSAAAKSTLDESVVDGLVWLASQVDIALWSGAGADGGTVGQAWSAVSAVRRGLDDRSRRERVRAALDPRCLVPPRVAERGHRVPRPRRTPQTSG
ncbi:transglutaminase family protein [Amycolatopsis sp. H20-H5]|uniref:transglutaminase family protein n=1 Tax=Amycolatopsis sp. H20-H5 TaxID=3046309 RepID=UPI002DB85611|nr:transglutaminaseTgpA domain-containing protein [Amycolatopsis sp. H20-H5]MEC3982641.1 transglutaminaseTgpA domain-containing protein [Amycolatopsis sp. H20-H5]